MQRDLLYTHYQSLFEQQSRDTSATFRVYRDAVDLLGSRTSLPQIVQLLKRVCDECLFYARRDGTVEDAEYGTYGNYMLTKKALYEELIRDVLVCYYEELAGRPDFKDDLPTLLSCSLLVTLQQQPLAQVKADLHEVIHRLLSCAQSNSRQRKAHRKAATIYADVLLALGGNVQNAPL